MCKICRIKPGRQQRNVVRHFFCSWLSKLRSQKTNLLVFTSFQAAKISFFSLSSLIGSKSWRHFRKISRKTQNLPYSRNCQAPVSHTGMKTRFGHQTRGPSGEGCSAVVKRHLLTTGWFSKSGNTITPWGRGERLGFSQNTNTALYTYIGFY